MRVIGKRWGVATVTAGAMLLGGVAAMTGAAPAMAGVTALSAHSAATVSAVAPNARIIWTDTRGLVDIQTNRCLDSNASGQVYTNPCQVPGNRYQDWVTTEFETVAPSGAVVNFFSMKDVATGRCLDSNAAGSAYTTNPCQAPGNAYQTWYGNGYAIQDGATSLCLDSNSAGKVYTLTCNGGGYQKWGVK